MKPSTRRIDWIKNYIKNLPHSFRKLVKTRKSTNRFKFGNPEVYESQKYFLIPVKFGKFIKLLGVDGLKADVLRATLRATSWTTLVDMTGSTSCQELTTGTTTRLLMIGFSR